MLWLVKGRAIARLRYRAMRELCHVHISTTIMGCSLLGKMAYPSVNDLVGLSDEELNKEITSDKFHEIGPSVLKWKVLAPILKLTQPEVEAIERDNHGEELKRIEFLSVWKQKQCERATYMALVDALCEIERREDARKVCEVLKGEP